MAVLACRVLCFCLTTSTVTGLRAPHATFQFISYRSLSRGGVRVASKTFMSSRNFHEAVGLTDIGGGTDNSDKSSASLVSWRTMINDSITKSREIRGGNYVQLATVDGMTNEPRCRTVVFRGFLDLPNSIECDEQSCVMKMITDNRSKKIAELQGPDKHEAMAEMVWWFSQSSEQYRIRGEIRLVGDAEKDNVLSKARRDQWDNLSDLAREQFFWKGQPGDLYSGVESAVPAGGRNEEGNIVAPPDTFLLMLVFPKRVHYLRLGDNFAQVDEFDGGSWLQKRVNP